VRPYETLIIFDAEIDEAAVNAVLDRAAEIIRAGGGERGPLDLWGKRAFAYELKHKREGYYVVMEFTAVPSVAADVDRLLDLADEALRHKTMRLPDGLKKVKASASDGGTPQKTP
jgi:small subunit ribosomal protein S6